MGSITVVNIIKMISAGVGALFCIMSVIMVYKRVVMDGEIELKIRGAQAKVKSGWAALFFLVVGSIMLWGPAMKPVRTEEGEFAEANQGKIIVKKFPDNPYVIEKLSNGKYVLYKRISGTFTEETIASFRKNNIEEFFQ